MRRLIDWMKGRITWATWGDPFDGTGIAFHNQRDKRPGGQKPPPTEARVTLGVRGWRARLSWNLWVRFCHAYVRLHDDETVISASVAFPPVALWFGIEPGYGGSAKRVRAAMPAEGRKVGVDVHDWIIWVSPWAREDGWSRTDPWWWKFTIAPLDLLFGREAPVAYEQQAREVLVPMPERSYAGRGRIIDRALVRPRFPWWPLRREWRCVDIEVPGGIPVPGRGENSYDCDDDAFYGQSGPGRTIEDGIGKLVASVLRTRRERGWRHDQVASR